MITQPDLRPKPKGKDFLLWEDYTAEWMEAGQPCRLFTKAGFITDIASVPSACAILGYKPDGAHRAAAVTHDRLYQNRGMMPAEDPQGRYEEFHDGQWVPVDRTLTREQCDNVFLELMLTAEETPSKASTMYKAVRIFGGFAW